MDMMDAALGSISLASSEKLTQYSANIAKKAMDAEASSAAKLLEMLPQQQAFQARGPQSGDVPEVARGNFFDTYA